MGVGIRVCRAGVGYMRKIMLNFSLIRQLSQCFNYCETDEEVHLITETITKLTNNKEEDVQNLNDSRFQVYVMGLALSCMEKVAYDQVTRTPLSVPFYRVSKIALIKKVRELKGWGLKESKDYVEALPLRFL